MTRRMSRSPKDFERRSSRATLDWRRHPGSERPSRCSPEQSLHPDRPFRTLSLLALSDLPVITIHSRPFMRSRPLLLSLVAAAGVAALPARASAQRIVVCETCPRRIIYSSRGDDYFYADRFYADRIREQALERAARQREQAQERAER